MNYYSIPELAALTDEDFKNDPISKMGVEINLELLKQWMEVDDNDRLLWQEWFTNVNRLAIWMCSDAARALGRGRGYAVGHLLNARGSCNAIGRAIEYGPKVVFDHLNTLVKDYCTYLGTKILEIHAQVPEKGPKSVKSSSPKPSAEEDIESDLSPEETIDPLSPKPSPGEESINPVEPILSPKTNNDLYIEDFQKITGFGARKAKLARLRVKDHRDNISTFNEKELKRQLSPALWQKLEQELDSLLCRNTAARWILRGLSPSEAIQKAKIDFAIRRNMYNKCS